MQPHLYRTDVTNNQYISDNKSEPPSGKSKVSSKKQNSLRKKKQVVQQYTNDGHFDTMKRRLERELANVQLKQKVQQNKDDLIGHRNQIKQN